MSRQATLMALGMGLAGAMGWVAPVLAQASPGIGLPIACELNVTCFVQQYPDMAPASGEVTDPWCGGATYDGHDGTDIRIRSLQDMTAGVPVVSVADGTVLRVRDGEPDHLVMTPQDRAAVEGKECGNGVVVEHGNGLETQYCHLRKGSIVVKPGQPVQRADTLGMVGASGLAQFPHVHLTVRKDGDKVDPSTGQSIASGSCSVAGAGDTSLWDASLVPALGRDAQVLDMGLSDRPIEHARLVEAGAPPPTASSNAVVGWVWMINLRQGDRIHLRLDGPDGRTVAENTTEPMDRNKATYSAFIGKRGAVSRGSFTLNAWVVRNGVEMERGAKTVRVE